MEYAYEIFIYLPTCRRLVFSNHGYFMLICVKILPFGTLPLNGGMQK